ncbi:hypothetical protein BP00DRAFT_224337 [Aspergillus indologenus CBS 114.80]|uniref:Uncharacterized protein n=1 Tax=Aspergillus indologenus CBS 114.80 TaxID=1450541 RepID=A0A2V5I3U7_9EURO|nr:hypothetical protein BP00DRAFT_224337 [Aspergillus indologenus CBS 114.80]
MYPSVQKPKLQCQQQKVRMTRTGSNEFNQDSNLNLPRSTPWIHSSTHRGSSTYVAESCTYMVSSSTYVAESSNVPWHSSSVHIPEKATEEQKEEQEQEQEQEAGLKYDTHLPDSTDESEIRNQDIITRNSFRMELPELER